MGRLGRPHGIAGELHLLPYNPDSDLFAHLEVLEVDGVGERVLRSARRIAGERWLVRLEGIDDRDAAAALTHREVRVPREALPEEDDDEGVYLTDLVGLAVRDAQDRELGVIQGVEHAGDNDLLVVRSERGEWLLPAADAFLTDIDVDAGVLRVELPEGLVEIGLGEPT